MATHTTTHRRSLAFASTFRAGACLAAATLAGMIFTGCAGGPGSAEAGGDLAYRPGPSSGLVLGPDHRLPRGWEMERHDPTLNPRPALRGDWGFYEVEQYDSMRTINGRLREYSRQTIRSIQHGY